MSNNLLCDDLIVEIFSWLPTKTLLRFRSLSKSLCVRISSPDFIRSHTLRSPKKFTIIHRIRYEGESDVKSVYTMHSEEQLSSYTSITPFEYPFGTIRSIVGSCNGILCVYEFERGAIHLWNPSIRRKATVHELPSWGHCLARGFGFNPIIDDYKILRISKAGTFVYAMKARAWREIASPATALVCCVNPSQCLFNGALHWVVGGHYNQYYYILTFDLSSEVFSRIELPEPSWETSGVTIIKGCLAVISSKDDDHRWIWVMRDYNNNNNNTNTAASWSVATRLNTHERPTHGDLLFSHYSKGILIYNPMTEVRSRLVHLSDSSCIVGVITCIESLGLLDMGTACDIVM